METKNQVNEETPAKVPTNADQEIYDDLEKFLVDSISYKVWHIDLARQQINTARALIKRASREINRQDLERAANETQFNDFAIEQAKSNAAIQVRIQGFKNEIDEAISVAKTTEKYVDQLKIEIEGLTAAGELALKLGAEAEAALVEVKKENEQLKDELFEALQEKSKLQAELEPED